MKEQFENDFFAYKTMQYPTRTVIYENDDHKTRKLIDAFSTSYKFTSKAERDFVASQFKKDKNILKVHPWEIKHTRGKNKGNSKISFWVSIYWPR